MLAVERPQDDRQEPGDADGEDEEGDEPDGRLAERPPADPEERQEDGRDHDPGAVLDRAPAEQGVLGRRDPSCVAGCG